VTNTKKDRKQKNNNGDIEALADARRALKNHQEMGLLSLSNLEICIKKAEFSDFKG
jgi:hypothetical protein